MKKYISLILVIIFMFSLVACKQAPTNQESNLSVAGEVDDANQKQTITSEPQVSEQTSQSQTSKPVASPTQATEPVSQPDASKPTSSQPEASTPTTQTLESTIATPKEVRFYKDGKYHVSKNEKLNNYVAQRVESWYKNYVNGTLPTTKTAVSEEMIANIKYNETAVEIYFDSSKDIELLGKIQLESVTRLLVPLTGNQAYFVFRGISSEEYKYQNGLHRVNGSGLEKYFEGMTFENDVKNWQSTVIAPKTVTFYKDGKQSVSTDKELNYKIARHIEEWFKYKTVFMACLCLTTNEDIIEWRYNQTAIELEFDDVVEFYGGGMKDDVRKIFIPIDGDRAYWLFSNDGFSNTWGDKKVYDFREEGLDEFFENRTYEPMSESARWSSTIASPLKIQLYKKGEMIKESSDKSFNFNVAKQIESWFLYDEDIEFTSDGISDTTLKEIRENETYIELFFNSEVKVFGEYLIDRKTDCLLIPLSGIYSNCVFASGDSSNYNEFAFSTKSKKLDAYLEYYTTNN